MDFKQEDLKSCKYFGCDVLTTKVYCIRHKFMRPKEVKKYKENINKGNE